MHSFAGPTRERVAYPLATEVVEQTAQLYQLLSQDAASKLTIPDSTY